jgi:hypothetical protein
VSARLRRRGVPTILALALLAGGVALAVTRGEPASAWTIQQGSDEIVLTSERLHSVTVRATLTLVLHRNGDILFRVEAHNSGATRKYFEGDVKATFTDATFDVSVAFPEFGHERIGSDSSITRERVLFEPRLAQRWDRVLGHPIEANFHLDANRVQGT